MDEVTTTTIEFQKDSNENELTNLLEIIIKKQNIGLEEHQHQTYQYHLFNNQIKRNNYYEDLIKIKDRLEKTIPDIQHVIHRDIKRMNTNKIYERQLIHILNGPKGLNWQYKQQLKRLKSDECDIERDLIRLSRDLRKISVSTLSDEILSSRQNQDFYSTQTSQENKRSLLKSTNQVTVPFSIPINQKQSSLNNKTSPWKHKQIISKSHQNHSYRQKHRVEQKPKKFLH
ncbi:unnamed protein product [Adineta steineri]|uniref:Uncharacterized protein n=1 Tax=Adineta steineri TaxID=433720 RepID=A0A814LNM0_9BILA|nr:unnamed protein product [Adineta steineri]CAF4156538.1 unnamed protein product [Adineta steineri]